MSIQLSKMEQLVLQNGDIKSSSNIEIPPRYAGLHRLEALEFMGLDKEDWSQQNQVYEQSPALFEQWNFTSINNFLAYTVWLNKTYPADARIPSLISFGDKLFQFLRHPS